MAQLGKAWMKRSSTFKIGVLANRMWRFNKNNLGTIIGAGWFLNFSVLLQIGAYKNPAVSFLSGYPRLAMVRKNGAHSHGLDSF